MDLYFYIDESGTIPKPNRKVTDNDCFILGVVITTQPTLLNREFKKGMRSLISKNSDFKDILIENKEIKGSSISEKKKTVIYNHFYNKNLDVSEIGVVQLHNSKAEDKFRNVPARTFNYLVWLFIRYYFAHSKILTESIDTIHLIIDERNVAPEAKHDLAGYLEMKNFEENSPIFGKITVKYVDSKNENLVQFQI